VTLVWLQMEASGKRVSAGINIRIHLETFDRLPLVSSATATRKLVCSLSLLPLGLVVLVPAGSGGQCGWAESVFGELHCSTKSSFSPDSRWRISSPLFG